VRGLRSLLDSAVLKSDGTSYRPFSILDSLPK
jgi:hypothetical protein